MVGRPWGGRWPVLMLVEVVGIIVVDAGGDGRIIDAAGGGGHCGHCPEGGGGGGWVVDNRQNGDEELGEISRSVCVCACLFL